MILKLVLATVTDANYGRFALFALCTKDFKATDAAFGAIFDVSQARVGRNSNGCLAKLMQSRT